MTNETTSPVEVTQEREWTRWSDQRPPNAPGEYRYRASFDLLGIPVTAEWTEKMSLCGMGCGDSEWWPLSPCYWNGYRRYITIDNLEWSAAHAYDQEGVLWSGLELDPCPFTGKAPKVATQGQYIGAPLWRTEAIWLSSPAIPARRWTDAKAMQTAWNTRIASRATDNALAEEPEYLNILRFLAQWLKDASGSRDESCGYVAGNQFQMMTMCPDPEALASAINSIPRILAALEGEG